MKKLISLISLVTYFTLAGCGEPVIDASSEEALSRSFEKIHASVPENEKRDFFIAFNQIRNAYLGHKAFRQNGESKTIREQRARDVLDGKNYQQILNEVRKVRKTTARWQIEYAQAEKDRVDLAFEELERFELLSYKIYRSDREKIFIDLSIRNGTRETVYMAQFRVTFTSTTSDWNRGPLSLYARFADGLAPDSKITATVELFKRRRSRNKNPNTDNIIIKHAATQTLYGPSGKDSPDGDVIYNSNIGSRPRQEYIDNLKMKFRETYGEEADQV